MYVHSYIRHVRAQGPVPLYHQILQLVRVRIATGDYAAGAALPTDEALMREFGVSRHTVRAAMNQLVSEGLIERFPGRGSFVVERARRASQWTIQSVEDLIDTSFVHTYRILAAREIPARTTPRIAAELAEGHRLFHVRAVRASRQGPYAYSNVWFPGAIGEKLPRHLLTKRPLVLLVEEYAGLPAYRTRQTALAAPADREAARHLGLGFGAPVLVLERTYYGDDDRPLEHTRIQYRPDRYQQVVNFWRRQAPPYLPSPDTESRWRSGGPRRGAR